MHYYNLLYSIFFIIEFFFGRFQSVVQLLYVCRPMCTIKENYSINEMIIITVLIIDYIFWEWKHRILSSKFLLNIVRTTLYNSFEESKMIVLARTIQCKNNFSLIRFISGFWTRFSYTHIGKQMTARKTCLNSIITQHRYLERPVEYRNVLYIAYRPISSSYHTYTNSQKPP